MTKQEIHNWIAQVLHEQFEIPLASITAEANLYTDLDIDSIDAVDLAIQVQQMTGKRIKPEDFKNVRTVGDVINTVKQLMVD